MVDSRHTFVVSKNVKNSTAILRTCREVQGIQEENSVDNKDIGTHGFEFVKKENKTRRIYLLKILIQLWPGN